MRLVSVVMGAPSVKAREAASAALLNYGYTFFETVRVKAARETVLKPRVYGSAAEFTPVGVPYDVYATVARGQAGTLRTSPRLTHQPLTPPLAAATPPGELAVVDGRGDVGARAPRTAFAPVPEAAPGARAR